MSHGDGPPTVEILLRDLAAQSTRDDFPWVCQDFVAAAAARVHLGAEDWIEPLLAFIQEHPDADYGSPGPLVHFLEEMRGPRYHRCLAAAMGRKPNLHLSWMAGRLLNGDLGPADRARLMDALAATARRDDIADPIRVDARKFLETHGGDV